MCHLSDFWMAQHSFHLLREVVLRALISLSLFYCFAGYQGGFVCKISILSNSHFLIILLSD